MLCFLLSPLYSCVLLYVLVYVFNRGGAVAGGSDSKRYGPPAAFTRDGEYVKVAVDSQ